jgi:hypothetical protein
VAVVIGGEDDGLRLCDALQVCETIEAENFWSGQRNGEHAYRTSDEGGTHQH